MTPSPAVSAVANRTKRVCSILFPLLVAAACLSGCHSMTDPARLGVAPVTFERHEIQLGSTRRQTVLTGDLLEGGMGELAVVHIDGRGDRRLRIHAFGDDGWAPALDAVLRPGVLFVDVANIAGRDRLISYEPGRLNWFDPESSTEHELLAVITDFEPPFRGKVLHVDVTRDLNADGRDDLVVPYRAGFRVSLQAADGDFSAPESIGADRTMRRVYGADGYRYDPWASGLVHEMDYDLDGRTDLVFWNEDHFVVHHQDEQQRFATTPATFTTEVRFDSDEMSSLVAPGGGQRRQKGHAAQGALSGRVLNALADMNGDGVGDLVIFDLETRGDDGQARSSEFWDMSSALKVHFGSPTPGGTGFATEPGAVLRVEGTPFAFDRHDFDHDGQVDVVFTSIDPTFFKIVGTIFSALAKNTVSFDLQVHRMVDGAYGDRPAADLSIKFGTGRESGKTPMIPAQLVGDVNGDGRLDLLVQEGREELRIHLGVPGGRLVAGSPQTIDVAMPADEEFTWLVDLDRNGKQDVLIHHPFTTGAQRVTLLIAE